MHQSESVSDGYGGNDISATGTPPRLLPALE